MVQIVNEWLMIIIMVEEWLMVHIGFSIDQATGSMDSARGVTAIHCSRCNDNEDCDAIHKYYQSQHDSTMQTANCSHHWQ